MDMLTEEEEQLQQLQQEVVVVEEEVVTFNTDLLELSPEEIAWVDSCIVSDESGDALEETRLETVTTQVNSGTGEPFNQFLQYKQEIADSVSVPFGENAEDAAIRKSQEVKTVAGGEENGVEGVESLDSIFKVWELEKLEDEEDDESDLIKQLEKVLIRSEGNKAQFKSADDELVGVEELAASMVDLSLKSTPKD